MHQKIVRHLRRNVIAYAALFVALGGTTYAVIQIPKNSVGSGKVRNNSIRGINAAGATAPPRDQRGVKRVNPDVGAFERR